MDLHKENKTDDIYKNCWQPYKYLTFIISCNIVDIGYKKLENNCSLRNYFCQLTYWYNIPFECHEIINKCNLLSKEGISKEFIVLYNIEKNYIA